jgi:hypothetical protein
MDLHGIEAPNIIRNEQALPFQVESARQWYPTEVA